MRAPYEQIVAALRERIRSGELAPGDRVPSTRELTRQWGVAMATATKALTALRTAGLVRAVPGVGTVVAGPRSQPVRSAAGQDGRLAPGLIVSAAVRIADAEGLNALSMRRVATSLGVSTMALYRHLADKDDLVLQMMDTVLHEWRPPDRQAGGWRTQLETAARTLWQAFRAHPWLASALSITRPQPITAGMAYTEFVLSVLDGRGLDPDAMLVAHLTLFNYVRGTAINLELEADAEASTGLSKDEWLAAQEPVVRSVLRTGDFPVLTRINEADLDVDLDVLFETGLRFLLDGLAVSLSGSPAGGRA